mgnify:CR=1 FL=1
MNNKVFSYAIIDSTLHSKFNINLKAENVRYNRDKSKFIYKFLGENTNITDVSIYSKNTIKNILKMDEWRKLV